MVCSPPLAIRGGHQAGSWLEFTLVVSSGPCSRGYRRADWKMFIFFSSRPVPGDSDHLLMTGHLWWGLTEGLFVGIRSPITNQGDWRSFCNFTTAVIHKMNPWLTIIHPTGGWLCKLRVCVSPAHPIIVNLSFGDLQQAALKLLVPRQHYPGIRGVFSCSMSFSIHPPH